MHIKRHNKKIALQRDDGQAIVEFVIVLPILVLLVFGIMQFGVLFHNYLTITDAARVGARAAAVKRTAGACPAAKAAIQNTVSATQWTEISGRVTCTAGANVGDPVTVQIKHKFEIGLPDFSASGDLTASATERLE